MYGIGSLKKRTSALNRSLSETGIALRDPFDINNLNPAAYTSIQGVTQIFELGVYYEKNNIRTTDLSQSYKSGNMNALNLWFRYSKRWAGTIGLSPYSNINYDITTTETLVEGGRSSVNYSGLGGISQFYMGNGFQLTKNFSIGFNAAYIFGSLTKNETVTFLGAATTLQSKIFVNRIHADVGMQYTLFLGKSKSLTIGTTYDNGLKLNTSSQKSFYSQSGTDTISFAQKSIGQYRLPRKVGGGISFQTPASTIAWDVVFEQWSRGKLENNVSLQNTLRLSVGYEYKGKQAGTNYIDMIRIRTGFYVQENYLVIDKTPFNEWGFTVGLGLPVNYQQATIGVSYNYNNSGTLQHDLIKQQASVFVFDITVRDLWGIKRKIE